MNTSITWDTRNLERAMATYARTKGKSDADVVNRAMRYWLPFAANKFRAPVTPGPARLKRELMSRKAIVSKGRKRGPRIGAPVPGAPPSDTRHTLLGTRIAAIIAGRLIKKHGSISGAGLNAKQFYDKVQVALDAKVRSANYVRSGFIPAFRRFNVPNRTPGSHTRFKGRSKGIKAIPSLRGTVEAFATNQREGAMEIAPDAFRRSIPEVRRQFLRWLRADINRVARQSGFF